ncbi:MAG: heavy-metal-associated domain-containing protein [bacterium JZ-2024 1]
MKKWWGVAIVGGVVIIAGVLFAMKSKQNARVTEEIPSLVQEQMEYTSRPEVQPASWQEFTMQVEGMTCASCVASVEKALTGIPGVKSAQADLKASRVTIKYDPSVANLENLKVQCREAIEKTGYKVVS